MRDHVSPHINDSFLDLDFHSIFLRSLPLHALLKWFVTLDDNQSTVLEQIHAQGIFLGNQIRILFMRSIKIPVNKKYGNITIFLAPSFIQRSIPSSTSGVVTPMKALSTHFTFSFSHNKRVIL